MRKNMKWIGIYFILAVLLFPADMVRAAETGGVRSVGITVTYGQTEARSMLQMINDFRTGSEAWAYDQNGNKEPYAGLGELGYDYGLEKIAMQRAAEIAVYFDHTRPNGKDCFTLGMDGENIAAGSATAAEVFEGWKETNEPYEWQGHRRNMLGSAYTAVGIGHVIFNGVHYWVQEFGSRSAEGASGAVDLDAAVQIDVLESYIKGYSAGSVKEQRVVYGERVKLPLLTPKMQLTKTWPAAAFPINGEYTWSVEDETVAAIEEGTIVGKRAGSTILKVNEITGVYVPLTVEPYPIQGAEIRLSVSSCDYDGTAQTPDVQAVILDGRELSAEDYTVSYENNIGPGTAKAVIAGVGNYQGTAEKEFAIICRHQFDEGQVVREATCTEAGERLYTCMLCKETKTEPIGATGHTGAPDRAEPPTCITEGKTEGSHCSVCGKILITQEAIPATGHAYERIVTKATTQKDGQITEVCSRCAHIKSQTVIFRPGTVRLSAKSYVYDGKEKRPSVTVTDRDGKRIGSQSYKVSYAKGRKNVGTYKVTVEFKGEYTGQMSQTFTIRPKSTSLIKVQGVNGRKMKVKWKRSAAASGYQIQYAPNASFKGAGSVQVKSNKKVEQTISKLAKGKRYHVRIRTYKTVSGQKIYSDWSGKKTVTIRK